MRALAARADKVQRADGGVEREGSGFFDDGPEPFGHDVDQFDAAESVARRSDDHFLGEVPTQFVIWRMDDKQVEMRLSYHDAPSALRHVLNILSHSYMRLQRSGY